MNYTLSVWLKNIRKMHGLTLDEVSECLGGLVTKQAISKYERGLMQPSSVVMEALCKLYRASPDFLLGRKQITISDFSFRSKEQISKKVEQRIISEIRVWIEHYLALENLLGVQTVFRNPVSEIKISDFNDIENAALQVRRKWNLGNDTIASVCRILEISGIKVLELEFEEDIDGLCGWVDKKVPFIVLKKNNITIERKRFTALHELAHILFPSLGRINIKTKEKMCHRFASAILLPTKVIDAYVGRCRDSLSIAELSLLRSIYGISIAAIVHRLKDLNVISDDYYNHIFDERIKKNRFEEGWGIYPFQDEAIKYTSLVNRTILEGFIKDSDDLFINSDLKVKLGEIEIM